MTEAVLHGWLVGGLFVMAAATCAVLLWIDAPYGRHLRPGAWGPEVSARLGWVLMELPASVFFFLVFLAGDAAGERVPQVLAGLWLCHYLHRNFVYPLRMPAAGRTMPVLVAAGGFAFNLLNAYLNARAVSHFGRYDPDWLTDPRFLAGAAVFAAGFALNVHSDHILLRLRRPGRTGYAIPRGGGFRLVSCPNYLGEIIEWGGWALAAWSSAGLAFFAYTAANLGPRARSHHRWYRARFRDYPPERKALIPWLA